MNEVRAGECCTSVPAPEEVRARRAGGGESAPGRRASLRAAGRCAASAAGWRSGPCAEVSCWRHLRPALQGHVWALVLGSPAPALSLACISGPRKGLLIKSQTVTLMKRSSLICEISHTVLERGDDFLHEFAVILSLLCLARRSEPSKQVGSLASLSDAPPLKSGLSSLTGAPSLKDSESKRGNTILKDLKLVNDKIGSLGLGTGEEDDYVDDFNSTSHRSEKSELSIGEEIEEDLSVEIDDVNTSDKLDDLTQDLTVSQLSDVADYLEDVA
ncbi:hypothetical protein J1605_020626 [Eschrichtius robustus]|uniref:FGFR1 oncogene partner n=1 Tax=Eschrichtius robustus TaxID=9764 RepID=A0AB34HKK3_ESCRO|nr:hypothetical protein J1605_020626 [Eschrichtius robustus]